MSSFAAQFGTKLVTSSNEEISPAEALAGKDNVSRYLRTLILYFFYIDVSLVLIINLIINRSFCTSVRIGKLRTMKEILNSLYLNILIH